MASASPDPNTALVLWLKEKARRIRLLEQEAEGALYEKGDKDTHRDLMVKKARLLAAMRDEAEPLLAALPEAGRRPPASRLAAFSQSADSALTLNSIFYMSALLYPDDHIAGQPTNLDLLITALEMGPENAG